MKWETYQRDRRDALKRQGRCITCKKLAVSDRTKCETCAEKSAMYQKDRYDMIRRAGECLKAGCEGATGGHVRCQKHETITRKQRQMRPL